MREANCRTARCNLFKTIQIEHRLSACWVWADLFWVLPRAHAPAPTRDGGYKILMNSIHAGTARCGAGRAPIYQSTAFTLTGINVLVIFMVGYPTRQPPLEQRMAAWIAVERLLCGVWSLPNCCIISRWHLAENLQQALGSNPVQALASLAGRQLVNVHDQSGTAKEEVAVLFAKKSDGNVSDIEMLANIAMRPASLWSLIIHGCQPGHYGADIIVIPQQNFCRHGNARGGGGYG